MKKFLSKFLILFSPILIIILIVNVYIDSGFLFRREVKNAEIASLLVSGKNVGVKQIPSDWGALQISIVEELIRQRKNTPKDIVVFGTSRSSEIRSEMFPNNTFFNCVVPGGSVNDLIALYGLYKRYNLLPKYLILNIDFCTFHAIKAIKSGDYIDYVADSVSPLSIRADLYNEYRGGLNYLKISPVKNSNSNDKKFNTDYFKVFDNALELLSLDYFQANIRTTRNNMIVGTDKYILPSYFVVRNDGGYSLKSQEDIDSLGVIEKSKRAVKIHKSNFFISSDTNNIYFNHFKKLLIGLKKDGTIPIVFISPVNPILYDNLVNSKKVAIEEAIQHYCIQNNIILIGSFNPHRYGYNYSGRVFIDEYHPASSTVKNIFSQHRKDLRFVGIKN